MTRSIDLRASGAIVTGGGHGIGRALAERLATDGARVVVADIHEARAAKVAERIGGVAMLCDVADPAQVTALVDRAEDAVGPVDVVCSNAGIVDMGAALGSTPDQLRRVVDVNLLAHVWAAQAALPRMVERGRGWLVQTISSAALITGPSPMGYTLTKHGALGFAEWVALNYAHLGVTVTCLCPNAVNTGMLGRNEDAEEDGRDGQAGDGSTAEGPSGAATAQLGDVVEPELCAELTLEAMASGRFLVLPHPRVGESFNRKADDYDAWLAGTSRRLRRMRGETV